MQFAQGSLLITVDAVQKFLDGNGDRLGAIASGPAAARFGDAAAKFRDQAQTQTGRVVDFTQAVRRRVTLREQLIVGFLRPIAVIARAEQTAVPELAAIRLPRGTSRDVAIIRVARMMADVVKQHAEVFTNAGLDAGFVDRLEAAAVALENAVRDVSVSRQQRAEATTGVRVHATNTRRRIHVLHALVRDELRGDEPFYSAWLQARYVTRKPRRGSPADEPASVTPTTSTAELPAPPHVTQD